MVDYYVGAVRTEKGWIITEMTTHRVKANTYRKVATVERLGDAYVMVQALNRRAD